MIKFLIFVSISILIVNNNLALCSNSSEVDKETSSAEKNPFAAGLLAGFVGFGSGHLYVEEQWTKKTTLFAGLDLLGWSLLRSPSKDKAPHLAPEDYLILAFFVAQKSWQVYDAVKEANLTSAKPLSYQQGDSDFDNRIRNSAKFPGYKITLLKVSF